jgi:predicted membrane chloride channel (bestrophin family)
MGKSFHIPVYGLTALRAIQVLTVTVSPWSYAADARWFTPVLAFLVGLLLFGAENLAQEVEQVRLWVSCGREKYERIRASLD